MNLKDQIVSVYQESRSKTMHIDEVARLLKKKYTDMQFTEEELSEKVGGILGSDVKKKRGQSLFTKIRNKKGGYKRGIYKLRTPGTRKIKPIIPLNQPRVNSLYTGKAGEFAVMSELLFYGFNPSLMTVDDGIDIIAGKDNKYFHIQVKTSNASKEKFSFKITNKAFSANNSSDTFYILAMRIEDNLRNYCEYIILPTSEIQRLRNRGVLRSEDSISITIERLRGNKYILNGLEDVSWTLNRFDFIK